jgi:hypothetical protein
MNGERMSEMDLRAKHTCWDSPEWEGTMLHGCPGCDVAEAHPCDYCGYGHIFTTHNYLAHLEDEPSDPIAWSMTEDEWNDRFAELPYVELGPDPNAPL